MARDLRLALRIQADLGQTPERLNRLKGQLGGVAGGANAIRRQSGPAARGLRSLGTAARDAVLLFGRAGATLFVPHSATRGLYVFTRKTFLAIPNYFRSATGNILLYAEYFSLYAQILISFRLNDPNLL